MRLSLNCGYFHFDDRRHVNDTYVHIKCGSQHRLRIPTIVSRRFLLMSERQPSGICGGCAKSDGLQAGQGAPGPPQSQAPAPAIPQRAIRVILADPARIVADWAF
jgi:hypothetical protein